MRLYENICMMHLSMKYGLPAPKPRAIKYKSHFEIFMTTACRTWFLIKKANTAKLCHRCCTIHTSKIHVRKSAGPAQSSRVGHDCCVGVKNIHFWRAKVLCYSESSPTSGSNLSKACSEEIGNIFYSCFSRSRLEYIRWSARHRTIFDCWHIL